MRRFSLLTLLVVTLAACGATPSGSRSASATADPQTTTGRTAPNFTLQLGNGDRFILSEETRPVFLVFWAEW